MVTSLNRKRFGSGFTLIELLVVITIIGVLTATITVNFTNSREKAKDRALMAGLKEMQLALEVYKSQNDAYPTAATISGCQGGSAVIDRALSDNASCQNTEYIDDLAPEFIGSLPQASAAANDNCVIQYYVDAADESWYKLMAQRCMSDTGQIEADDEMVLQPSFCPPSSADPNWKTGYRTPYDGTDDLYTNSIAVYSPAGACY